MARGGPVIQPATSVPTKSSSQVQEGAEGAGTKTRAKESCGFQIILLQSEYD